MSNSDTFAADLPPTDILHRLIDSHGIWATLGAFLRVLVARRRPAAESFAGTDHLRRDLGLPERNIDPPALRGPLF